jgi:predicted transcriptional regulator
MCTFTEHKDHNITQFSEAVGKYKDNIQQLMFRCKEKIERFDKQLESLNRCEEIIKTVEQRVHDKAIEFIQEIRNREKQIIEELQNIYGPDCMEQLANKKDLIVQVTIARHRHR